jgi:hypothetical protein
MLQGGRPGRDLLAASGQIEIGVEQWVRVPPGAASAPDIVEQRVVLERLAIELCLQGVEVRCEKVVAGDEFRALEHVRKRRQRWIRRQAQAGEFSGVVGGIEQRMRRRGPRLGSMDVVRQRGVRAHLDAEDL